jgi:hypothetical protein
MNSRDIAGRGSRTYWEIMHQRKFESTQGTKRSKRELVCTFEKRFKTEGGIRVSDPWGM